jgi:hypothetical protein
MDSPADERIHPAVVEAEGKVHLQLALGDAEHAVHAFVQAQSVGDIVQLSLGRHPELGAVAGRW